MAYDNDELTAGQYEAPSDGSEPPATDQDSGQDRPGNDRPPGDGDSGDGVGQWPSQFAQVLAETLAGARPASQLTPWTTERARAHIRRLGPLLAVDRRPRVQRVRASQPARDVVEVAVVAEFGSRTRALAARLERAGAEPATPGRRGREARWLCTAIESA
ncbi:MAG TPA: Rv3235 family protein [Streptosporangiaceae bacterium]